jgi:hypothetical protein
VAKPNDDPAIALHREWLGYVQPTGLLVAPAALVARGVVPDSNIADRQRELDALAGGSADSAGEYGRRVENFIDFAVAFLGWDRSDVVGAADDLPTELGTDLLEYGERLVPTYAIPKADGSPGWQMLIRIEDKSVTDLDQLPDDDGRRWNASPHDRFERLLRDTNIPIGLLTTPTSFRLVYAPKGETSGFATFELDQMLEVAGRPMLSAFNMLLNVNRLFGSPDTSLATLLAESRQFQETVSTKLSEQVLISLNELLRGFYAADVRSRRTMTVDLAKSDPELLYSGLLSALIRLVFILYAEDRGLFPNEAVWIQNYSIGGLFARLRDDAALFPDTMDDRYGAWAHLLALYRLVYAGSRHRELRLIARYGRLFDPDRFPFLEGRGADGDNVPAISDGVVWRILQGLMVIDGERLSYRTLDVEQIGSVYQSVMGFTIEVTHHAASVAIHPDKRSGAAGTISLEELAAVPPEKRPDWIAKRTDRKLTPKVASAVKAADGVGALEEALAKIIDVRMTPKPMPPGVPVLQPTETRRRSGSHYTPRALTAPIVAEAFRPIFERLGPDATAEEVLALRVLDPALGSGAFLVEACRQLAERLTIAWERHGSLPSFPADQDALSHARRLVAQQCLYGVDRNEMAVDLAKLSIWLATLAKDHEFTFVDHAIKHGDALVGLSTQQLEALHWAPAPGQQVTALSHVVRMALETATKGRDRIRLAKEGSSEKTLAAELARVDAAVNDVRLIGNALLFAFFSAEKAKGRENERRKVVDLANQFGRTRLLTVYIEAKAISLVPFHWELEFPEVFERDNPGFDAIVGNPPYAGKNTISAANPRHYIDWLQAFHLGAHGNADLVAHFFRRAFGLLRQGGTLGFIATKTVRQGDTRVTGLQWLRDNGATIYTARRRYKWPGEAAVLVSVIHFAKGEYCGLVTLNDRHVRKITAFLFDQGGDGKPPALSTSSSIAFIGFPTYGNGFLFADDDGDATPVDTMRSIIEQDQRNAERIFPYIGGREFLRDPMQSPSRYVICFEDFDKRNAEKWPRLMDVLRDKVYPTRQALPDKSYNKRLKARWWLWESFSRDLFDRCMTRPRMLMHANLGPHMAFGFIRTPIIVGKPHVVFDIQDYARFAVLQSRVHEVWVRFFGSSLEDRLRYTPSDVFETFPFPHILPNSLLFDIGSRYFEHRAKAMLTLDIGLTTLYNLFNDPAHGSPQVQTLRELHLEMDRVVLGNYGWTDLIPEATFEPAWSDDGDDGPARLLWPEEFRDEVLGRLLRISEEQHNDEAQRGLARNLALEADRGPQDYELDPSETS